MIRVYSYRDRIAWAAQFHSAGGSDDVASTESRIDASVTDLAAGEESPLLSEPVAVSRDAFSPLTDAHGFMVDDIPEDFRRVA